MNFGNIPQIKNQITNGFFGNISQTDHGCSIYPRIFNFGIRAFQIPDFPAFPIPVSVHFQPVCCCGRFEKRPYRPSPLPGRPNIGYPNYPAYPPIPIRLISPISLISPIPPHPHPAYALQRVPTPPKTQN